MESNCPRCGAPVTFVAKLGSVFFECESGELNSGKFHESDQCKDRQLAALKDECEAKLEKAINACNSEHDWYYSRNRMAEAAAIRDLIPKLMQLRAEPAPQPITRLAVPESNAGAGDGPKFAVGDAVSKVGGDYRFDGIVRAAFAKLSGVTRYVVEDDRGVLFIYGEPNLTAAQPQREG